MEEPCAAPFMVGMSLGMAIAGAIVAIYYLLEGRRKKKK